MMAAPDFAPELKAVPQPAATADHYNNTKNHTVIMIKFTSACFLAAAALFSVSAPAADQLYASLNIPAQGTAAAGGSTGTGSSTTDARREAYQTAKKAVKQGDTATARHLMQGILKDYPLTVWLDYYLLAEEPAVSKFPAVMEFINSGRQHELADLLRSKYIEYLAGQHEFAKVYQLYGGERPYSSAYEKLSAKQKGEQCRFHEAAWRSGHGSDEAVAFANQLYLDLNSRPAACSGLIALYDSKGYLTDRLRLERFERAYVSRADKSGLVKSLASELSYSPYAAKVKAQMYFYSDPAKIFEETLHTDADRRIAALAFCRYANFNPNDAAARLDEFIAWAQPTEAEMVGIYKIIALRFLERDRPLTAITWVDQHLPALAWSPYIKEQRLRRAVWFSQWDIVYQLLDHVDHETAAEINWRYWKGRSAREIGREEEGRRILTEVAADRSFFGFLAAQELGLKAAYNQLSIDPSLSWPAGLHGDPAVTRFFELYAMDDANSIYEWREIAKYSSEDTALLMAEWALRNGNSRLAIDSVVSARRWDALAYRFPIVYKDIYQRNAREQNVSLSLLYGVSRQESMLNPVIRSPAGAVGLMQLMPDTARLVSRQRSWSYSGTGSLTNPEVNVRLGSAYLRDMLDRFHNNRILAAAAYNAGPGRIPRWESKDGLKRDAAMYIENIPFLETRKYVQNVLLYDAIYNKLLTGREKLLLSPQELNFAY